MLKSTKQLKGYEIFSYDGKLGLYRCFLFDPRNWNIRYVVIKTTHWLANRFIFISPRYLVHPKRGSHELFLNIMRNQLEQAPVFNHYLEGCMNWGNLPYFWISGDLNPAPPVTPIDAKNIHGVAGDEVKSDDSHQIKFSESIEGFTIAATDGDIGRFNDFIIDDATWNICYLNVYTPSAASSLFGRSESEVLVEPAEILSIDATRQRFQLSVHSSSLNAMPASQRFAEDKPTIMGTRVIGAKFAGSNSP